MEGCGLVGQDGEEIVCKFGVVDGQEVFDFDGEEVKAVGQVGNVAETAPIHRYRVDYNPIAKHTPIIPFPGLKSVILIFFRVISLVIC